MDRADVRDAVGDRGRAVDLTHRCRRRLPVQGQRTSAGTDGSGIDAGLLRIEAERGPVVGSRRRTLRRRPDLEGRVRLEARDRARHGNPVTSGRRSTWHREGAAVEIALRVGRRLGYHRARRVPRDRERLPHTESPSGEIQDRTRRSVIASDVDAGYDCELRGRDQVARRADRGDRVGASCRVGDVEVSGHRTVGIGDADRIEIVEAGLRHPGAGACVGPHRLHVFTCSEAGSGHANIDPG